MHDKAPDGTGRGEGAAADFLRGARDIWPVMVATAPFGLLFGALSVKAGISATGAVAMSALVFGGASQFVALQSWAHPLPFFTVLFSALAVNLRNVLYSAAIGRKMRHWSPPMRWTGFALLTDPAYAYAELKGGERLSFPYYMGLGVPLYANWIVATAAGLVVGSFIARPEAIGLDFLVTAYFLSLLVGFRKRSNALPVIAVSIAAALLVYLTIGPPWHFAGGALGGMATGALLAKPREDGT
jgi:4-azaleucine resistance transporter AzlC